jgi:O-antigen/teichoic acid export membrane protein
MADKDHLRNGGWHGALAFVRSALAMLTSLLALRLLGSSDYGHVVTWMSLFVVYLSLCTNAFTMLVVGLMDSKKTGEQHAYSEAINAAVAFSILSITLLFSILLLSVYYLIDEPQFLEQLPSRFVEVVLVMGLLTVIQIFVSLQAAVIEAEGRLDLVAKTQLIGPSVILILLLTKFFFITTMVILEYVFILCVGAVLDAVALNLVRHSLRMPIFLTVPNLSSVHGLRQMLRSGGILQAASLLNLFLEPLNKFLLNSYSEASSVATYDLAMKVLWGIQHFFASAMRVFLHIGNQGRDEVGRAYAKVLTLFGGPIILAHIVGLFFIFLVAKFWVAIEVRPILIFFTIAAASNFGMICVTPLYMGLIARSQLFIVFKMHALLAFVNVLSSLLLIPYFGLFGSAFGLFVATAINCVYIYRKCDVELAKLVNGNHALVKLWKRVGVLVSILLLTMLWCILGEENLLVLCLLLLGTVCVMWHEPLFEKLLNSFLKK